MKPVYGTKGIQLGPLNLTQREWADLWSLALKRHDQAKGEHPAVTWISEFLDLAQREGYSLELHPNLSKTRELWRN